MNRMLGEKMCQSLGYSVITAENGLSGIKLAKQHLSEISLILMDIQMPVLDGVSATRVLRRHKRFDNIPLIAMTANVRVEDQQEYQDAGMDGFLSKPFNQEQLDLIFKQFAKA